MEMIFDKLHRTTVTSIGEREDDTSLAIIGRWYYKFISSSNERLRLTFPKFSNKLATSSFRYLRNFSLIYDLVSQQELQPGSEHCLFDIFLSKDELLGPNAILPFNSSQGGDLYWGDGERITKRNRFLPVFLAVQLVDNELKLKLIETFSSIFYAIAKHNLIEHPILIDLENSILLLSNGELLMFGPGIIKAHHAVHEGSPDDLDLLSKQIKKIGNFSHQIIIRYPYHRLICPWLINDEVKRFELIFNDRFIYDEEKIDDDDIIILPKEIAHPDRPEHYITDVGALFNIFETGHKEQLYELMNDLRSGWEQSRTSIYKEPFPKYWFTFVNQGTSVEDWQKQFERDYPSISQKPIMQKVNRIINELHSIDWIKRFMEISKSTEVCFYFPELKGVRSRTLAQAYIGLNTYINSFKFDIYTDLHDPRIGTRSVLILNVFDFFEIINIVQSAYMSFQFLVPDIIFYSYNPWILYQLQKYQWQVFEKRPLLDLDEPLRPSVRHDSLDKERSSVLQLIDSYTKKYRQKEKIIKDGPERFHEDLILNNEEENAKYEVSDTSSTAKMIEIITSDESIRLPYNSKVNVFKSSLIRIAAGQLVAGDLFFTDNEMGLLISKDDFYDKLSDIPENVQNYHQRLKEYGNAYEELTRQGMVYLTGRSYFIDNFCLGKNHNFKIPKMKSNWRSICELLIIPKVDMDMAYISYYGRRRKNKIIEMYRAILKLLMEENRLGQLDNPEIIALAYKVVLSHRTVFDELKDIDLKEMTISILEIINNKLYTLFKEVKEIKI